MHILILSVYILFCLLVAWAGRRTFAGFVGVLIFSVFLTPLLTAVLVILFRGKVKKKTIKTIS